MSYHVSVEEAVRNAGRFLKEGGMEAVKLEGGRERLDAIRAIVRAGIPVMGHLGLTPQSIHALGGFHPQGRTTAAARRILEDALSLEEAGCFSPRAGIGSGPAGGTNFEAYLHSDHWDWGRGGL